MNAQASPVPRPAITQQQDALAVQWSDGHESVYHFVWLRDCCYCEQCGDSYSSNRFLQPSDVALDIEPETFSLADGALAITWNDGHRSRYELDWLRRHCYSDASLRAARHQPILWGAEIADDLPEIQFELASGDDRGRLALLRKLRDYGFVIVRSAPANAQGLEDVAHLIGTVEQSAYGKVFDLSPKSAERTLGNTHKPVAPHTDEAFRYSPPGVNVLHCERPATAGGDSVLVDGFNLGEQLRRAQPEMFRLLATQPQAWHRLSPGRIDQRSRAPVFRMDEFEQIVGFRFHTRSAAPLDVPATLARAVYAANHRLSEMMLDATNQARFRLQAGDAVLFDNHRVMHARTAFDDPDRMLRICNVSRESFHERLRLLAAKLGHRDEADQILAAGVAG